jgi:hypothetical protein
MIDQSQLASTGEAGMGVMNRPILLNGEHDERADGHPPLTGL